MYMIAFQLSIEMTKIVSLYMYSLQSLNISWTSLEMEDIMELSTHVNDNLLRLNIAGCRKTMTDAGKHRFIN